MSRITTVISAMPQNTPCQETSRQRRSPRHSVFAEAALLDQRHHQRRGNGAKGLRGLGKKKAFRGERGKDPVMQDLRGALQSDEKQKKQRQIQRGAPAGAHAVAVREIWPACRKAVEE